MHYNRIIAKESRSFMTIEQYAYQLHLFSPRLYVPEFQVAVFRPINSQERDCKSQEMAAKHWSEENIKSFICTAFNLKVGKELSNGDIFTQDQLEDLTDCFERIFTTPRLQQQAYAVYNAYKEHSKKLDQDTFFFLGQNRSFSPSRSLALNWVLPPSLFYFPWRKERERETAPIKTLEKEEREEGEETCSQENRKCRFQCFPALSLFLSPSFSYSLLDVYCNSLFSSLLLTLDK